MKEEGKSFHLVGSILISVGLREGDKSCPRLALKELKVKQMELPPIDHQLQRSLAGHK